uniref:Zinc finger protein 606 n=1 Tax=Bactrocera latifrons TaxID=174628 RepID=A0A0K8UNM5_BACLA
MRQDLKLCRLCTGCCENKTTTSLFDRSRKSELRRIFQLTNIQLKNLSNLPSAMCSDCEKELERAYEFRNRCISAQTYFSSSEYMCHFDPRHRQKKISGDNSIKESTSVKVEFLSYTKENENRHMQIANSMEKESTSVKVEFLSYNKEIETCDLDFNTHSDTTDLHLTGESECNFDALNEGDMVQNDDQVELENQSLKNSDHELLPSNKTKAVLEENQKKDRDQEEIISQTVKSDNNGEDPQSDDNQRTKTKEEKQYKPRTYICDQCGNNFKYRSHFYSHIKRHAGVKPLQCEVCPNKFFTEGELKRHMRRHTGERPFPCQYCERRFTDYSTRIKHERTHTNERPFGCSQCGKAFTTSYVLKNHMLVHTGERSFKYLYCKKKEEINSKYVFSDVRFAINLSNGKRTLSYTHVL